MYGFHPIYLCSHIVASTIETFYYYSFCSICCPLFFYFDSDTESSLAGIVWWKIFQTTVLFLMGNILCFIFQKKKRKISTFEVRCCLRSDWIQPLPSCLFECIVSHFHTFIYHVISAMATERRATESINKGTHRCWTPYPSDPSDEGW